MLITNIFYNAYLLKNRFFVLKTLHNISRTCMSWVFKKRFFNGEYNVLKTLTIKRIQDTFKQIRYLQKRMNKNEYVSASYRAKFC